MNIIGLQTSNFNKFNPYDVAISKQNYVSKVNILYTNKNIYFSFFNEMQNYSHKNTFLSDIIGFPKTRYRFFSDRITHQNVLLYTSLKKYF